MFTLARCRNAASALVVSALALVIAAGGSSVSAQARTNVSRLSADASGQPWRNPRQPAEVRANELLAVLSTDQKIQLALGNFAALASFGVPVLKADDGPNRLRNPGATAMSRPGRRSPRRSSRAGTGLRAWWGPRPAAKGSTSGSQGPAVDIARTPLAGRQPEAEGEGPVPGRQHRGTGDPRRPGPAHHLDAQALHRLQPGLGPDRLRDSPEPVRPRARCQRRRVRTGAAGDLRGAVPHRGAAGPRGLGDVLL